MEYLYWLTICVWAPLIILWARNWSYLSQYKKTVFYCIGWALLFSVPWDFWAIQTKIWIFPTDTNVGVWIGGLPLEEYFFIVFVTMLISTSTLLFKKRFERLLSIEQR